MYTYVCCCGSLLLNLLIVDVVGAEIMPAEKLLKKFGTNNSLNAAQTTELFAHMGISSWDYNGSGEEVNNFQACTFRLTDVSCSVCGRLEY